MPDGDDEGDSLGGESGGVAETELHLVPAAHLYQRPWHHLRWVIA